MDIEVTRYVEDVGHYYISASPAELGPHAARLTWDNANAQALSWNLLDDDEKRSEFKDYVQSFGAWSRSEIDGWSPVELNALFLQFVSGCVRECGFDEEEPDFEEIRLRQESGELSSSLYRTGVGSYFYYIGV